MKNTRAIVTGGGTNIGRAISVALMAGGGRVVVGQPDPRVADSLVQEYGDRVTVLRVDVSDPAQCRTFIDEAAAALGGVDVLVNNAAISGGPSMARLADLKPDHFDEVVKVNLGGVVFCSQAALPHFRAAGGGVIVNISSINALRPQQGALVYAATKAAVSSVTRSMGKELASDGIRAIAVAPGDIQVDTSAATAAQMAKSGDGADVVGQTPLGQGDPGDIAATVAFLCSDNAKFVTGTTWVVDGGLLA